MIDATALPGTSLMSEAETTSDLAEVAACLRDGNAAREQQRNAAVKVDGRWAASSRNQLKKVTSDDELQLLYDTIGKVRDRVVKNMHAIMSTIFGNYLWGSDIIGCWTQGNLSLVLQLSVWMTTCTCFPTFFVYLDGKDGTALRLPWTTTPRT